MDTERWPARLQRPPTVPFCSEAPQVVGVEITGHCQLRCRHCFNLSGPDNLSELPLDVIVRLLDEMQAWGARQIRLSGGEPTYHCQFREIVAACRLREISVVINSHGVYAAPLLEYLRTAPIEQFLISVDGLEPRNDAIRGQGTFRRAVHACQQLQLAGQKVMIGFHVGADNQADLGGLAALAADIGVDVKVAPIRPLGRAAVELPDALIRPRDFLAIVGEVTRLRRQFPHTKLLTDFDILDGPAAGSCQRDPRAASCKAGRSMVNINYDGGIYPCAFFVTPGGEWSAGNIYRDSVTDVWRSSPIFEPFRAHQKPDACQACAHYQRRCAGGCPAIAYLTAGYLDAHDPTCFAHLIEGTA